MAEEEKDLALREQAEVFSRQLESAQMSLKVSFFLEFAQISLKLSLFPSPLSTFVDKQ